MDIVGKYVLDDAVLSLLWRYLRRFVSVQKAITRVKDYLTSYPLVTPRANVMTVNIFVYLLTTDN